MSNDELMTNDKGPKKAAAPDRSLRHSVILASFIIPTLDGIAHVIRDYQKSIFLAVFWDSDTSSAPRET
jgi:hypothetical protein